ncbi:EF-hand domain-containing protein [Mycena venus]|uniref:EF-hand domain-containing protein n=1 Tax=Mycena venus TaxID=2733690 RepID=A0A8H7CBE4_9AGAR|nr:EF-hand domain-containing protein [Mycena venus]
MSPRRAIPNIDVGPSHHHRLVNEPSEDGQAFLFSTPPSAEDLLASPPYKKQASRVNLLPDRNPSPSPSYRSSFMPNAADESPTEKGKTRAAVHYPADIVVPPHATDAEHDHHSLLSAASSAAGTDDEDDAEYDWSDEEETKFEERMGTAPKKAGWSFKRFITLLFSSLIGSTFLAGVLVTPGIILYFFWYKPSRTPFRHKVTLNVQAWLFWAAANLLISWYLALIIDIVPSIVRFMISVAWGHVSEAVKSHIEMYNSVKNTVKPVFYAASAWVSWVIIFGHIFKLYGDGSANHMGYTHTVFQVVEFFFFFTLVLCAQRLLSHLIAFAFHRTAFKDRLDAVEETLKVVEKLREYHPKQSKRASGFRTPLFGGFGTPTLDKDGFNFVSSKLKDHKRRSENGDIKANGGKAQRDGLSVPGSRPMSIISEDHSPHQYPPSRSPREPHDATLVTTAAKALKSAMLHDARNIEGKDAISATEWNVNSPSEAKRLARSIYMRFKSPSRNYILPADFHPAFPTVEEADAAFRVFDKDNNGDLSRAELKTTLMKVYKERRFLARAMRDVGAALKTLDNMLLFLALIVQFFISLSVFGVNVTSSLTSVYTLGIGASFIFKTAASSAFDSIMFLFVTHPFDTGDRCFIDNEVMVVKKMTLFATVFTRWDGTESYYFNSQLTNKFITNVRRSGKMFESLTMQVAWRTPLAKLDALEAAMNTWLSTEQNRWFVPGTGVTLQHIDFQRYLEFTMAFGAQRDWGLRSARKTAFHAAVQHYCRELGIVCYNSPQPIVWGDPNLDLPPYPVASPAAGSPDVISPTAVSPEEEAETEVVLEKPSPMLGFTPPMTSRVMRARTRGKKAARAVGGDS